MGRSLRILMIAYGFPPCSEGGVFRTLRFVKYLPSFGWQPVVLTVKDGIFGRVDPSLLDEIPKGVQVIRARSIEPRRWLSALARLSRSIKQETSPENTPSDENVQAEETGSSQQRIRFQVGEMLNGLINIFFFPDQTIGWIPFVVMAAGKLIRKNPVDIVYTSGSPWSGHVAGAWIKKTLHVPWVADYRDFWTLYRHPTQVSGGKLRQLLEESLEQKLMKTADINIFVNEPTHQEYLKKYPRLAHHKMRILTNGFDPQDFQNPPKRNQDGRLTILHTGTASVPIYRMDVFFKALSIWYQNHPHARRQVVLRFVGELGENERYIELYGLQDVVSCEPACSHQAVTQMMQSASVLLIVLGEHSPATRAMKALEYLAARRPIWAVCVEGATSEIVREGNCGWISEPVNELSIIKTLDTIIELHLQGELDKFRPSPEYIAHYDGKYLTKQLADWLSELVE